MAGPSRRRLRDHPRSRGVYAMHRDMIVRYNGSSPLARGLRGPGARDRDRGRIIPARAGFTRGIRPRRPAREDHPRSRGVYTVLASVDYAADGSSPLARGLPASLGSMVVVFRIIPARAGFTRRPLRPPRRAGDHPRSRGVYGGRDAINGAAEGSSPLARGLRLVISDGQATARIIPARAGFT